MRLSALTLALALGFAVPSLANDGTTALHLAVYHEDLPKAQELIENGANPNARNRYGVTPLALACENANPRLVKLLLGAGADPNSKSPGNVTPLLAAAKTGSPEAVSALLAAGAKVSDSDSMKQTPLMWAAAEGHPTTARVLLDAGADPLRTLKSGFSPWFFAARNGRSDVTRVFLEAGLLNEAMFPEHSNNRAARQGTSALVLAIENGHFELARVLLRAGADPNDQRSGYTALHVLTWVRKPDSGDDPKGDPSPIGSGNLSSLEFVRSLVEHGADVNTRLRKNPDRFRNRKISMKGATPFFMASRTADLPFLRLLLELGADPAVINEHGTTALMAAAGVGTHAPTEEAGTEPEILETIDFLLELGAGVNLVDRNGETAMHGAAYKSLPEVVNHLTAKGAEIDVWDRKNRSGWTPLVIAQGFRPGNFKPSAPTIAALQAVMRSQGVEPPPPPERKIGKYLE